jgi:phage shock protein PspC (stress-responsive transcriptional regulator)
MDTTKKLYRSTKDRMLGGVCGGLADYMKLDATLVRLLFVVALLFGSLGFWAYVVMWIIVPEEPAAVPPTPPPTTS